MTGNELLDTLTSSVQSNLPGSTVQKAYDGVMTRRPVKPIICLSLQREDKTQSGCSAQVKISLYLPAGMEEVSLFQVVSAAVQALSCPVQSISRGEKKYEKEIGCFSVTCTVTALVNTAAENRRTLYMNGQLCSADDVLIVRDDKTENYRAVGETEPFAAVKQSLYTVALSGFSGEQSLLEAGNFTVCIDGVRYTGCAWKRIERNAIVFTATAAEKITAETGEE